MIYNGNGFVRPGFPPEFIPYWIPAFAGMTDAGRERQNKRRL